MAKAAYLTIHVFETPEKKWDFSAKAANGKTIFQTDKAYNRKADARREAERFLYEITRKNFIFKVWNGATKQDVVIPNSIFA